MRIVLAVYQDNPQFHGAEAGGATPLVAFVDGVSPFSPTFAPAAVWKKGGGGQPERLQLHLQLPERKRAR